MSVNMGGTVTSNSPQIQGVDGGVHKQKHSRPEREPSQLEKENLATKKQFHAEAVKDLSNNPESPAGNPSSHDPRDKSDLSDHDKVDFDFDTSGNSSQESADHIDRTNAFHNASLMDIMRALFGKEKKDPRSTGGASFDSLVADSSNGRDTGTGLIDIVLSQDSSTTKGSGILRDNGIRSNSGIGSDTGTKPDTIIRADADPNTGRVGDLMYYGQRAFNDATQLTVNTANGPVGVQLNPLIANNGETVRTQLGQPLVQSMGLTNSAGMAGTIDFRDIAMAGKSGIPQQGLILDSDATRMSSGSIVMLRQDGARIAYQPYIAADNTQQARITAISSQDGNRVYVYNNPSNPGMATGMIDNVRDYEGGQLLQMRERVGNSNTSQMYEYQMQNGRPALARIETEVNAQTRLDGQLVYQNHVNHDEIDRRAAAGEFDNQKYSWGQAVSKEEIVEALKNDKTWLVANDLPAAKRQLLNAMKGRIFGGDDEKAERFIDMYITRIRDWRKKGYKTATDDQLAFSLRRMTETLTAQRSGTATQVSDNTINKHFESMLMGMASPKKYNNQGQIGTCYVNSYRLAAEYIFPHLVIDKWASVMTTGKTKRANFTAAELNRTGLAGQNRWNYIGSSICDKYRYGANHRFNANFPGTAEFQAKKEYKLLTDGGNLPLSKAARKLYGLQIAYTYGMSHAQTWIENWLNNTWNGYGERGKGPSERVEKLPC